MKADEIIELGMSLGLSFSRLSNYETQLNKDIVVFDGCNGQRFLIDGNQDKTEIMINIGRALITFGRRLQKMEIHNTLSITGD